MRIALPLIIFVAIVIGAITWGRDSAGRGNDIVIVNRGEVFTLDPQRMSYVQDFRVAYALYEGLVRWNNIDFTIEPAAADLPAISADQREYSFQIKANARWSNGDPVTAHDFVYSFQRVLLPDSAADYSNLFFVIEGAEAFFRWRNQQLIDFAAHRNTNDATPPVSAEALYDMTIQRFAESVGVRAIDDRTLQIRLHQPVPYFLDLLCFAVCCPVHRPTVEGWEVANHSRSVVEVPPWSQRRFVKLNAHTGRVEQRHEWARAGVLVTNGPYKLDAWRYKRDMRLVRNPHYHHPEIVQNESVLLRSIDDANTAVLGFEAGTFDWLIDVSTEYQADLLEQRERYVHRHRDEFDSLRSQGFSIDEALAALPAPERGERRNIHAQPTFGVDFFNFNCRAQLGDGRANPFADAQVRRAFVMAIDKQAIVQHATRLNEPVMGGLVPPYSIPGYPTIDGLPFDRARARQELAAAGWSRREPAGPLVNGRGESFPAIDLLYTSGSERYRWISLELKAQWERELGVQVNLRSADTKFYKEDLKLGKFMIARGRWYGDYGDPTTFLEINRSGDGNNDRGFADARFDDMLTRAANERDAATRLQLLHEAERYVCEEQAPILPLCQLVQLSMYEPGALRGLTAHPRLVQYLWKIEAKRH